MNLKDAVVLVTGASRGIGRAISLAFGRLGACVVGVGRQAAMLASLETHLRQWHAGAQVVATDLTEPGACEALVRRVVDRHGRLDVLVNNAGIASIEPFDQVTLASWRHMMAINVEAPMLLMREALEVMQRQGAGRIINVASDAATRGIGGMATYCATKHALLGLGRAVNEELRGTAIRVTTLCPGPVTTTILGPGNPDAMEPEDVAQAAVLAASLSERSYVAELLLRPARI